MHIGSVLLVIWLVIGAIAAGQRGYYSGPVSSCTTGGTIAVTILAGPLNYLGVNPKVSCTLPQPSKLPGGVLILSAASVKATRVVLGAEPARSLGGPVGEVGADSDDVSAETRSHEPAAYATT